MSKQDLSLSNFTPASALATASSIVSLLVTQELITNRTAQLVTGLASFIVPAAFMVAHAVFHGRVKAAQINNPAVVVTPAATPAAPVAASPASTVTPSGTKPATPFG